ncbi:hypothetical protein EJB05_51307, partial [Eragrostis curvula]
MVASEALRNTLIDLEATDPVRVYTKTMRASDRGSGQNRLLISCKKKKNDKRVPNPFDDIFTEEEKIQVHRQDPPEKPADCTDNKDHQGGQEKEEARQGERHGGQGGEEQGGEKGREWTGRWRSFLQDNSLLNSKQQHFSPEIQLWTFRSRKLELGYKDGHPQGALGLVLLHNNPQADQEPPAATAAHIIVGQDNPPHDDIMEVVPPLPAADDDENADKASNKPDEAAPRSTRQERLTPLEVLLAQSMLLFKFKEDGSGTPIFYAPSHRGPLPIRKLGPTVSHGRSAVERGEVSVSRPLPSPVANRLPCLQFQNFIPKSNPLLFFFTPPQQFAALPILPPPAAACSIALRRSSAIPSHSSRMSGPDPGTPGWTRSSAAAWNAKAERRVPLGDFTNVVASCGGGRFGAADAEEEVNDGTKLKSFHTDIDWLNKRLREEEGRRIRAEAQHSKLQDRVQQLELQLASYTTLLGHKPHGSCCVNMPQQLVDLEKQASTNLNKNGDATLVKEKAESATEFDGVSEEKDRSREDHIMLTKEEPRDGDGSSLKEMLSDQGQMDVVGKLERIIDEMNEIITQQCSKLDKMNDRLSIERRKVISLERERDQLRSQVESKLGYGDYYVTDTEVPQMVNTLAVDCEEKPEVQKPSEWLQAVEELKGQGGSAKKQPILIEICDDEETSMWCDDDINPSNPSSSGELGAESWFFRGNKLMLSSGMKKHLKEICGFVPPEIPFYLYQMNKSSLKRKGRMRLSAKYTSAHLRSCFHKKEGCIRFEVDGEECGTVKINLLEDGRASLSSGWEGVVEAKSMKVGDICAFQFKVSNGDLKLAIHMFHVARYLVSLK